MKVPPSSRCRCRQEVAAGAALVVRKLVVVIQVALVELLQTSRRAEVDAQKSVRAEVDAEGTLSTDLHKAIQKSGGYCAGACT